MPSRFLHETGLIVEAISMRVLKIRPTLAIAATVAAMALVTAISDARAQAQLSGPMRPVNPATSVPFPPDTGVCETGTDKLLRLVQNVGAQCMKELQDNKNDYAWIAAHLLSQVWVPGAGAWVMEEFAAKFGKDATVCVLTGLVEFGGGSPQAQAFTKASIKLLREISDRSKYAEKASKAWDGFSKYGRDHLLKKEDQAKFLTFLDKKTFDRLKGTAKEASFVSALINLNDPTYKAGTLVPEARADLAACNLTKAAASVQAAEEIRLDWLRQVRGEISRLNQELRCLREEHDRSMGNIPLVAPIERLDPFYKERDTIKFGIGQLEKLDAEQTVALQETAELKANIESRARVVDETLRKPFNATKARAEQAFASCDYSSAEAHIKAMQRYTRDAQCQGELKSEFSRELELQNELQARLAKRAEGEELISRRFEKALAATGQARDCKALSEEAGYLAILTKDACVDQKAVQEKIARLNDEARSCELAKNGAGPAAAGNTILTMQDPVLDDKKYWAGVWDHNIGKSYGEYYSGEFLAASTHTWTPPHASVGPQGFPVTLTVECETGPKQGGGLDSITWIQVKGFQLVKSASDPKPIEEKDARAHVTCPRGGAGKKKDSLTVWVLPFPRYDDGAEAYVKIGGGPGVKYPYVAGRPKP